MDEELWILDNAATATDCLVGDVLAAYLTLVLYLDKLDVGDEAEHLDDVSDDLVGGDCLNQLDLIVSLEIGHLVLDLPDDLEVVAAEHELHVDVDRDGNFPHSIFH